MHREIWIVIATLMIVVSGAGALEDDSWSDAGDWDGDDWSGGGATGATGAWDGGDEWVAEGWGDVPASDSPAGFSTASVDVYGYVESTFVTRLSDGDGEDPLWGSHLRTRLKTAFQPQDEITARLELSHDIRNGVSNELVLIDYLGLNPSPEYQSTDPNDDYIGTLTVDHAYATINLGFLDLAIGKQPIAWGSAYLFNPTNHVGTGVSLEGRNAETPGTPAVAPTLYLGPAWAVGGYVALQPTGAEGWALSNSADADNLPFGIRLRGYIGPFDVTLSAAKEVRYVGAPGGYLIADIPAPVAYERYRHGYYGGFDSIGSIGDVGVYSEIALAAPQDGNAIDLGANWDVEESLTSTFGVEYTFSDGWSGGGLQVKAEYTHLGSGESRPSQYDPLTILQGSADTIAEDYLFLYASRTCCTFLEVTIAGLTNLNDGSVLLAPEAVYSFHDNFEATIGVTIPIGKKRTEYAGPFDDNGIAGIDLVDPEILVGFKASF